MPRFTGSEAILIAEVNKLTLSKYADPTEDGREGLSINEARDVAREDPSLIYLDMPDMKKTKHRPTKRIAHNDAERKAHLGMWRS
jgi:hypothetical protein